MKLLAIETSTDACSCALWIAGELRERFEIAPRNHGMLILSMVESLLLEGGLRLGELDGLAFGCGPGAFTGLRIAAGVIQGLAFSAELPVVPISSLAALAQGVRLPLNPAISSTEGEMAEWIVAVQDARMGEVYYSAFRRAPDFMVREVAMARVCRPERVTLPEGGGIWAVAGSGWRTYGVALAQSLAEYEITVLSESLYPHARDVARLGVVELAAGRGISAEQALPVYLRDDVTGKK
ncbi:tRNA threonylcarbamoyladenosine biosynthesis protein TsaB [Gammaproteobacteria bacterium]